MNEFSRVPFYGREVGGVCALSAKIGACLQLVGEEEESVDNLSFAHVFEGGKRMFRTNFPWEKFAWHFWRAYQARAREPYSPVYCIR